MRITQTEYDQIVIGIANYQTDLASIMVDMKKQGDPDTWRREEEGMMLLNIFESLRDYDIESEILTDEEINILYELATNIVETCPI
jgi:hypothetical protein